MLKHLLEQWSKTPNPWFSKRYLEAISPKALQDLKAKKILVYELPNGGEETVYEPRCPHGCTLFVERSGSNIEAMCLTHPDEGAVSVTEDHLSRYRFSIADLLSQIQQVNDINGNISPLDDGLFLGYKTHGDKTIGLVILPLISKDDLSSVSGIGSQLKDCHYVFVITPSLSVDWPQAVSLLGDRIVLLSVDEALDCKTLAISFDWGLTKLRQRGVLKDICLEITGVTNADGEHEIKINGQSIGLTDVPFLLLLRFVQGAVTIKDRWVAVGDLTSEGIVTESGLYQGIGRFKEKFEPYLPDRNIDKFIENGQKRYRLTSSVISIVYDRKKLVNHENGRIKDIAKKLPQIKKVTHGKKRSHKK